jgi:hypothetical protein
MSVFILILALIVLIVTSYFIIKDGKEQFDDDLDDPTITCWDDDKNHTEGGFH